MAKKNKVILAGLVVEKNPKMNEIKIKIRKNEKRFIYPRVVIPDNNTFKNINITDFVYLEGTLMTEKQNLIFKCPQCHKEFSEPFLSVRVNAQKVGILKNVGKIEEYINSVILLGVVCRDPEYTEEEVNGVINKKMKLHLAVNRREPNRTDYPIAYSFGRQAEEDDRRLQKGSQILIDGILNTKYYEKEYECTCGQKFKRNVDETEVHILSTEYLNHCIFDD